MGEDHEAVTLSIKRLREELAESKKQISELVEALGFYADKNNWMRSWITNGEDIKAAAWADKLKVEDCAMLNCGGGRARLALSKHKAKVKE